MSESSSVRDMWQAFLHAGGEDPDTTDRSYTAWHFCDNQQDADALAVLVRSGRKRATTAALWAHEAEQEPLPQVGDLSIITNWRGEAQCIIRTTAVEVVAFNEVSPEFARTEGEGDGSLEYWRRVHWAAFTRELEALGLHPDETMPVVCERFEVVHDPESRS